MQQEKNTINWTQWFRVLHRDFGYFFSALIIAYSLSGIALNHIGDWNPDFTILKKEISLNKTYSRSEITESTVNEFSRLAGEKKFITYDFPVNDQIKIYYDNASLLIHLTEKKGSYEKLSRRLVFYETNLLHRNVIRGWKWVSDIFGIFLILITVFGALILKGRRGILGRGKWLLLAGLAFPAVAIATHYIWS